MTIIPSTVNNNLSLHPFGVDEERSWSNGYMFVNLCCVWTARFIIIIIIILASELLSHGFDPTLGMVAFEA